MHVPADNKLIEESNVGAVWSCGHAPVELDGEGRSTYARSLRSLDYFQSVGSLPIGACVFRRSVVAPLPARDSLMRS